MSFVGNTLPMPAAIQADRLLTAGELAAVLRVSRYWIYECAKLGKVPCRRLSSGGRLLFSLPEVMAALEQKPRRGPAQDRDPGP